MKVSQYLVQELHRRGVGVVFELVGGMITHLLDAFATDGRIRVVSVHHEQAAAFAADAFGRIQGVPGVALATSGPGATNLLTGIGSCYFDSSPAIFITGQVNIDEQKGSRPIRQLGFQETDIVAMAEPITKAAWRVTDPNAFPQILDDAFRIATSGRPGPVLIDIPMDVQRLQITNGFNVAVETIDPAKPLGASSIKDVLDRIEVAERPLILGGGGLRSSRTVESFQSFVSRLNIPVVNSLMGVDVLPFDHPLRFGMIGSYGNRWANKAIGRSDFLLVLGSRLDVRQTGARTDSFREGRTICHVDCEPGEINNRVTDCLALVSELGVFLETIDDQAKRRAWPERSEWLQELRTSRIDWPDIAEIRDTPGINPNVLMHEISRRSGKASAFVTDVGQHQMWAAQSLELTSRQRFLTSGGMGAMGFGLPAAIGACFADDLRPVVLIAGDGGFQLNLQELQTVARNRLPLKMVVLDNRCHGMVRQFQESYFEGRYQSTFWGYSAPDFVRLAQAYDIEAWSVVNPYDTGDAIDRLWADPASPFLLHVHIDTFANAYPKLAFGHPITEMEPFAKPLGMEGT